LANRPLRLKVRSSGGRVYKRWGPVTVIRVNSDWKVVRVLGRRGKPGLLAKKKTSRTYVTLGKDLERGENQKKRREGDR